MKHLFNNNLIENIVDCKSTLISLNITNCLEEIPESAEVDIKTDFFKKNIIENNLVVPIQAKASINKSNQNNEDNCSDNKEILLSIDVLYKVKLILKEEIKDEEILLDSELEDFVYHLIEPTLLNLFKSQSARAGLSIDFSPKRK